MNTESTLKIYRKKLVIYYKHNNEVLRLSTGIYPNQREFDDSSKNLIGKKEKHNIDIKKKKLEIDELILRAIDEHSSNRVIYIKSKLTENENSKVKFIVSNKSKNKKAETIDIANNKNSLVYLYNVFLNEHYLSKNRIKEGTKKVWKTGLTDITKFVNSQNQYKILSDVDEEFINCFQDYLSECADFIENETVLKYTGRTIIKKSQCIKKFIVTNKKYLSFVYSNDNNKKITVYTSDVITFSDIEYDLIKNYQAENLEEQKIKDMTLVMCSTSLNISDLKQINKAFIDENNVLQLNRTKSHTAQYIPLNKLTIEILERNNYCMDLVSDPVYNRNIKKMLQKIPIFLKDCGYTDTHDGTTKFKPKFELISSRTCRKYFITYCIKKNMTLDQIIKIVGHNDIKQIKFYMSKIFDKNSVIAILEEL